MSPGEPRSPAAPAAAAALREELLAAGCAVVLESAGEGAAAEGSEPAPPTLHVAPKSVVALGRAVALLRARKLPVRVRGAGDAPQPPRPGTAMLDLSALDRISGVDGRACLARVEAGCSVAALEAAARRAGCTLGPLLPSVRSASVGAWLAGPTRGERGIPGSRRETAAQAVSLVLPDGRITESRAAPRSATGPDLDHLALGGSGRLGVLAAASVRLLPAAEILSASWTSPSLPAAIEALEQLCLERLAPARARVLAPPAGRVRLACAWEGPVTARLERARAARLLRPRLGEADPGGEGATWVRGSSGPQAVEVDARWGSLRAWAQRESGLPGSDLRLIGLHTGGAFAVLQTAGAGDADACAAAARACGARVLAPRRLRDEGPGWEAQGAGEAWTRLVEALGAEEIAP